MVTHLLFNYILCLKKITAVTSSINSQGCPGPPSNDERFRPCSNTAFSAGHNLSAFSTQQGVQLTALPSSIHIQQTLHWIDKKLQQPWGKLKLALGPFHTVMLRRDAMLHLVFKPFHYPNETRCHISTSQHWMSFRTVHFVCYILITNSQCSTRLSI